MMIRLIASTCVLSAFAAAQTAPNGVRLTKYVIGVADLDRTYAFYHALGLDFENPAAKIGQPNALPEMLLKLVDVPQGTKFRNLMLKIPGAPFSFEVTEFSGIELRPVKPRLEDPGASLLVMLVPDVDAAIATATKAGGEAAGKATVKDPDGYYVEFEKSATPGARFASVVQDAEKAAAFYRDHFGLEVKFKSAGASRAGQVSVPGSPTVWSFIEYKTASRKPYTPRIPDPGAPAVGLQVRDLDAAVGAVKASGGQSITTGGSVGLGGGKVGFVRDPSGILVELAQPR